MKHGFYKTVLVAYNFRTEVGVKAAIKNAFRTGKGLTSAIRQAASAGVGVIAMKTQAGGYSIPGGGLSPHQAALAWVLENPGVATAIPSMVSFSQVDENLGARGKRLSLGGRVTLRRYAASIEDRHCGLCGTCAGKCPKGVNIQGVLRSLTYYEGYREKELARWAYRELPPGADATACISCPECVVSCPLGLCVAQLARDSHGILAG
jgi:predicted aldo/keto reductase-like oxidoreductase